MSKKRAKKSRGKRVKTRKDRIREQRKASIHNADENKDIEQIQNDNVKIKEQPEKANLESVNHYKNVTVNEKNIKKVNKKQKSIKRKNKIKKQLQNQRIQQKKVKEETVKSKKKNGGAKSCNCY